MAKGDAGRGCGFTFGFGTGATEPAYTVLADTINIQGFEQDVGELDITHSQSPDCTMEVAPGITDNGTVVVECNFVGNETSHAAITALKGAADSWFQILVPDQQYDAKFRGFLKGISESHPNAEKQTVTFTIRVSGVITRADIP